MTQLFINQLFHLWADLDKFENLYSIVYISTRRVVASKEVVISY